MKPSQQHVALCIKGVEWGLGGRGLRMLVAFGPHPGRGYTKRRRSLTLIDALPVPELPDTSGSFKILGEAGGTILDIF